MTRRELLAGAVLAAAPSRPNILWITCEDLSPILGCYGDSRAHTPNLDRLASQGVRFTRAFSTASVCTPSRSCLITGVHATALGTMHLRGPVPLARGMNCFPAYLRRAGYYCTNNVKQDYNFTAPADAWDESSGRAHWRKRRPGQPFLSVFNLMQTHQGQIRYPAAEFEKRSASLAPEARQYPARAPLPPYYPDTPLVRLNIAELYTQVTLMDREVGRILGELEADGLAGETIVFFFSDHGTGLPRGKRWLNESGTRVPFIVRFPEKFKGSAPGAPGSALDRMVCFEDFPPTVLRLAGVEPPRYMTGGAFLGPNPASPRDRIFTARDRVDENLAVSRSVRDGRWRYIRHYHPHRPPMENSTFSEPGLVRSELRRLSAAGKLTGPAKQLTADRTPVEELFDLERDPHEIDNLASDPANRRVRDRLAAELRAWILRTRDTGFLPEDDMARRAAGGSPYDIPVERFPIERILDAAELCGRGAAELPKLRALLRDSDPAVRYWAAVGLCVLGEGASAARPELKQALADESPAVRIAAAEALAASGGAAVAVPVLGELVCHSDSRVALQAAVALWYLGPKAEAAAGALRKAVDLEGGPEEQRTFTKWTLEKTLRRLQRA